MFLVSEIEQYFFSCHWSGYAIPQRRFNKNKKTQGYVLAHLESGIAKHQC